ncbi:hypothetical protein SOM59_04220 [Pseudomonas coleopterorum]|jgi:hypothetical protein|uniref:hypothetical protein n=1 Tax=Pseudomonas coleopterorum TaxID=1605838 RepID=UPI001780D5E5|nr:hypothetical protein [Pseudomonas coleopterorum]MBD8480093.1 hypothetical protein [Pseudomonas coleopterorum]MDY1016287.1 hypothetical protein [Pseudomonas coleopterorum]
MSRPSLIGQAITPLACGYLQQHFGAMGVLSALCVLALNSLVPVLWVLPFVRHSASV